MTKNPKISKEISKYLFLNNLPFSIYRLFGLNETDTKQFKLHYKQFKLHYKQFKLHYIFKFIRNQQIVKKSKRFENHAKT